MPPRYRKYLSVLSAVVGIIVIAGMILFSLPLSLLF